jgi:hypothetical protein
VLDRALLTHLEGSDIRFCVIGGIALAVHGHARYTADVDLLTMDRRVLDAAFWKSTGHAVEIRVGDADDPLGGMVRWRSTPPHDLLVGRGYAMQHAVDTSVRDDVLDAPVATARALVLLKLEAGAPHDRNDVVALAEAQKALGTYDWRDAIAAHLPRLSASARSAWDRVAPDLPH